MTLAKTLSGLKGVAMASIVFMLGLGFWSIHHSHITHLDEATDLRIELKKLKMEVTYLRDNDPGRVLADSASDLTAILGVIKEIKRMEMIKKQQSKQGVQD